MTVVAVCRLIVLHPSKQSTPNEAKEVYSPSDQCQSQVDLISSSMKLSVQISSQRFVHSPPDLLEPSWLTRLLMLVDDLDPSTNGLVTVVQVIL